MTKRIKLYSDDWISRNWRPYMAWGYLTICMFDFLVAPVIWSIFQAAFHGQVTQQWDPLTLKGAGLFHLAMGAILGISSYGRTKEKMASIGMDGYGDRMEERTTEFQSIPNKPMPQDDISR
jgi:hypothetical protein